MTREEKIETIKEAVKSFSKRQIDVAGKGASIALLLRGSEKVTDKKLDEMLRSVQKLKASVTQKKQAVIQIVTQTEKAIPKEESQTMEAFKEAIVTQSEQIKKLWEDRGIQASEIKKLFEKMEQIITMLPKQDVTQISQDVIQIKDKLRLLEKAQVAKDVIQGVIQTVTQSVTQSENQENGLLGFRIYKRATITGSKKYLKWYAAKRIDGKQVWVYLGDDTLQAEEKIKAWLAKHPEIAAKLADQSV